MNSKYLCIGKDSTSTNLSMENFRDEKFRWATRTKIMNRLKNGTQLGGISEEEQLVSFLYACSQNWIAEKDWEFYGYRL